MGVIDNIRGKTDEADKTYNPLRKVADALTPAKDLGKSDTMGAPLGWAPAGPSTPSVAQLATTGAAVGPTVVSPPPTPAPDIAGRQVLNVGTPIKTEKLP